MDKEEIKKLKEKLEDTKAELEKEVAELKVVPEFGSDVDAFDEETDESQAYGNQLSVMQTFKERLADIDFALGKMEKGTYGICEKCGKEISFDVLEVDPESKLCKNDKQNEK